MLSLLLFLSSFLRSCYNLGLEILALRQQLGVLKRKTPRPRLRTGDRAFWILLRKLWPAWINVPIIVKPETVVGWHRAGFRLFWRIRSRPKSVGRPTIDAEVRAIIRRMVKENPTWRAPRIHGELLKLGFQISDRTVSRYIRRLSCGSPKSQPIDFAFCFSQTKPMDLPYPESWVRSS
jgi:putative transposase